VPGIPKNLVKVTSTNLPSIQISWSAPDFNGGSAVLSYNIYVDNVLAGTVNGGIMVYTESSSKLVLGRVSIF